MPKVSIVLPTYNGERYIRESIESILKQTFIDWELIVVNDCSADNTLQIVSEYAEADERIRIINNEVNQKLPNSLNIGFKDAHGEYLTWTSDDNIYLPNAVAIMSEYLDENIGCPMVCTMMGVIDSEGEILDISSGYKYENMLVNNCVGACFMYQRYVLNDIGEYDASRFLVEDYDYWLRILFHYGRLDYLKEVLYLYRKHNTSLSETRKNEIQKQLLKLRYDYLIYITEGLKEKKDLLCQVYYELKKGNYNDQRIRDTIISVIPEIARETLGKKQCKIIIYGAGNFGKKALEKYGDRVIYFADRNKNLIGKKINNIEIIGLEKLKCNKDYLVLIAVGTEKIYSCMTTLIKHGVEQYSVFLDNN